MSEAPHHRESHEERDINVRRVALLGGVLIVSLVVILGLMGGLMAIFLADAGELPPGPTTTPVPTAPPGLQAVLSAEWGALQATQEARLQEYSWVSEDAGVAHIPIDRAMALLLANGLPTPAPTAAPTVTPTAVPDATPNASPTSEAGS
ncbi:MAG: hypothetical protein H6659_13965 [Ardenticatenaceae bacterium]|nr:hypothetical protein [Ardenticatenaceae bacterium]MCB8987813.1 hypothetical protein [Ardenticatenaceae bacterium]